MSHSANLKARSWGPRRSAREPVALAGSAYGFARSLSVIIGDVSVHGALLQGRDLPPAGQDIFLIVGSFDTVGKVVWRSGDKCGIQYDDVIADETVTRMKSEAEWQSV